MREERVVGERRTRKLRTCLPGAALLILILASVGAGVGFAITVAVIHLTGVTILLYSDEVRVEDIIIFDQDTVLVIVAPTSNTVPGATYQVRLYLNGNLTDTATVAWTAGEVSAGVRKWVFFNDLDLTGVTSIQVEVVRLNG